MNHITLFGRLGADPETKQTGGDDLHTFRLATSRTWKDKKGDKQEATQWHNCKVWGKLGNVLSYVKKGDQLLVNGEIEYSENDGKYYTNINVRSIFLVGSSKTNDKPNNATVRDDGDSDLPF
jgi:single-strand DNA-binding protein